MQLYSILVHIFSALKKNQSKKVLKEVKVSEKCAYFSIKVDKYCTFSF